MPKRETRSPGTSVPARRRTGPPPWALAGIAGIVGTFALAASILSELDVSPWIRLPKPFDDNGGLTIVLFTAMCVAVIVVIVASKVWEAHRAAAWPPADGRVVKSATEARRHQFSGEATTVTNVPAVEYEFAVAGTTYRGARIGIGEDSGGANTEATLARYPVGATVTVYYDPADPTDCVLERDIPRGVGRGCALFAAIGAAPPSPASIGSPQAARTWSRRICAKVPMRPWSFSHRPWDWPRRPSSSPPGAYRRKRRAGR
jgi:hypothetical protein